MFRRGRRPKSGSIYSFAITWLILSLFFPMYRLGSLILTLGIGLLVAYLVGLAVGKQTGRKEKTEEEKSDRKTVNTTVRKVGEQQKQTDTPKEAAVQKKRYGPEIDPIVEEGNKALSEMGRLYMSIKDPEIRVKINEIMRITDKIVQDAISDPSDIPKIRKFMNYYLPTTIKLLNAYDRMDSQGIQGENINRSMKSITEMLDAAIAAYKKQLDSLFANQALDIETDIAVMNAMLDREGLSDKKDFSIKEESKGAVATQ